jgi:hypothetical protein
MEEGSNQLFPGMGIRGAITSIPYRELNDVYGLLESITSHIQRYTGLTAKIYIDESDPRTNFEKGELSIAIEIDGVSTPVKIDLSRSNKRSFKVKHPSVFTG